MPFFLQQSAPTTTTYAFISQDTTPGATYEQEFRAFTCAVSVPATADPMPVSAVTFVVAFSAGQPWCSHRIYKTLARAQNGFMLALHSALLFVLRLQGYFTMS